MLLYDHFITAVLLHMCDRAVSPNVKLIFFNPSHKMIHFILFMHLVKKEITLILLGTEISLCASFSCNTSFLRSVSRCFRAPPAVHFIHVFPRTCW